MESPKIPVPSMQDFIDSRYNDKFRWQYRIQGDRSRENSRHIVLPPNQTIWASFTRLGEGWWEGGGLERADGTRTKTIVYGVQTVQNVREHFQWPFAVKVFSECDSKALQDVKTEIKRLQQVDHVHIVSYLGSCETFPTNDAPMISVGVAMYPLGKKSLDEYMREISYAIDVGQPLSDDRVKALCNMRGFFGCISRAVAYLHDKIEVRTGKKRIKHKDIKPTNIIIDSFDAPILTDLGISTSYTGVPTEGPTKYTAKYAAPEVLDNGPRDWNTDIFSLGCVFMEMATLLQGRSLNHLLDFMRINQQVEDASLDYGRNVKIIQLWLDTIQSPNKLPPPTQVSESRSTIQIDSQYMNMILSTIKRMTSTDPLERPKSADLWSDFNDIYITPCSTCCKCDLNGRNKSDSVSRRPSIGDDSQAQPNPKDPEEIGHEIQQDVLTDQPVSVDAAIEDDIEDDPNEPLNQAEFPPVGERVLVYFHSAAKYRIESLHEGSRQLYSNNLTVCRVLESSSRSRTIRFYFQGSVQTIEWQWHELILNFIRSDPPQFVLALP